ncbi:MAG: CheR family methyltransferase [Pseudanabaenaceae cyanobacterium]
MKEIIQLIARKTGIKIPAEDQPALLQKIRHRIKTLGLSNEQAYLLLLSSQSPASDAEWQNLIPLITIGESYFLRDRGQINLIRDHILPDLYQRKGQEKKLTILSAGCATGEEAYSIALVLRETPCQWQNWQIQVIGIDLNSESIHKAQKGVYSEWSLRGIEQYYRSIYFRRHPKGWELIPSLKEQVKFYQANLITSDLESLTGGLVDLIICRNVFIYFDTAQITTVVQKFINLLARGGYLLTGHTELQGQPLYPLKTISYPESIIYQLPSQPIFQFVHQGQSNHQLLEMDTAPNTKGIKSLLINAKFYAQQQQYQLSTKICYQVLEQDYTCIEALYLLAHIQQAQGYIEQAREYLRRIIFLAPNYISVYFDLIDLYIQEQDHYPACQLLQTLLPMANHLSASHQARLASVQRILHRTNST